MQTGQIAFLVIFGAAMLLASSAVHSAGYNTALDQPELAKLAEKLRNMKLTGEPIVSREGPSYNPVSDFSDNLVEIPEEKSLVSSCASCANFIDVLTQATRNNVVQPDAENPSEANEANREVCDSMEDEDHVHACNTVAQMYGLENIDEFLSAAPELLCEPLNCADKISEDQATRAFDDVGDVLIGADASATIAAGASLKSDSDDDDDKKKGGNNMARAMKLMMAHRMYSMLNMKMMQDQQMGQQLVHAMMQKLIAAQERNREIKQEYLHFMKQAYRNQPGNCDCCDACLPPKKGGKGGKGGKGKKGRK